MVLYSECTLKILGELLRRPVLTLKPDTTDTLLLGMESNLCIIKEKKSHYCKTLIYAMEYYTLLWKNSDTCINMDSSLSHMTD